MELSEYILFWMEKGVMGAIIAGVFWLVWWLLSKLYVPAFRDNHKKDMELKDTLISNVSEHTRTLGNICDTLTTHNEKCQSQSAVECLKLANIEATVGNHTAFLEAAVNNLRQVFREHDPDMATRLHIEDRCNDMITVLHQIRQN